jgi:transcription elongation factor Elf1
MTLTAPEPSLVADTGAIAEQRLVHDHLIDCPRCGHAASVHIGFEESEPAIVRVVCSASCVDDASLRVAVIDVLYPVIGAA